MNIQTLATSRLHQIQFDLFLFYFIYIIDTGRYKQYVSVYKLTKIKNIQKKKNSKKYTLQSFSSISQPTNTINTKQNPQILDHCRFFYHCYYYYYYIATGPFFSKTYPLPFFIALCYLVTCVLASFH